MRRGAEVAAAALAALVIGVAAPWAVGRAGAQAPVADAGAQIDQVAGELAGLDTQVAQLQSALAQADAVLATAQVSVEEIRQEATSREQLQAQLIGQARAYAIQRYMYGSADSRDLLAFLSALNKPADDAVWGLATLEVSSAAALDHAEQVAKARAVVADRLAQAESDVVLLTTARARRAQELDAATAQRTEVATRFDGVVRELGQATVNGMSTVAYDAYRKAQATLAAEQPACALRWELLAAIGKTESNHGVGRLDVFGNSLVPIIGIPIGGDTDGGALDGDASRDHAVGPMQFIPSTWRKWATDANGDGKADPGNIVDAATAAGRYLCRAAGDLTLSTEAGVIRAILSYNPNQTYLRVVGARFEALASDLALGWFSAAVLPPAPAPVADVAPNAGPDGREATGNGPTLTAPPATTVTEVRVFGTQDLTTSTTAPVTIEPGECAGPTLALDPRAGFLRCGPTGARSSTRANSRRTTPRSSAACRTRPARRFCSAWPARRRQPRSGPRRRTGCWSWTAVIAACPSRPPSRPGRRRPVRRRPPPRRPARRAPRRRPRALRLPRRHRRRGRPPLRRPAGRARPRPRPRPVRTRRRRPRSRPRRRRPAPPRPPRPPLRRRPPPPRRPPPSRSPSGRPTPARAERRSSGRRTARARPGWPSSASPVWPTASSSSSRPSADSSGD